VTMSGLGQGPAQSLLRRSVNVLAGETLDFGVTLWTKDQK